MITPARQLARQAAGAASVPVWLTLVGLVTTPIILSGLGDAAYGVLATVTLVSSYLLNLEFGFGHATVRYLARASALEDKDAERAITDTSAAVFRLAAFIGGMALALLATSVVERVFQVPAALRGDAVVAFLLGALILAASFLASGYSVVLQAKGALGLLSAARALFATLSAVISIGAIALGGGLIGVVAGQLLASWLSTLVLRHLAIRALGRVPVLRLDRRVLREMAAYGALSFAAGLMYQLMLTGPYLLLAMRVPSSELPPYVIPNSILQRLIQLIIAASASFFPFASASSALREPGHLRRVFRSYLRFQIVLSAPIAAYLVVFGRPLLSVWIDDAFAARAALPLALMAISVFFLAVAAPAADVARAVGRPGWVLAYTAFVAAAGLFLAWPLSGAHGPAGAALALLLSVGMGTPPFVLIVSRNLMDTSWRTLVSDTHRPLLAAALAGGLWKLASQSDPGLPTAVATGLLVYVPYTFVAFRWILTERERVALLAAAGFRAPR